MLQHLRRRAKGNTIAEYPAFLYFLFFGIAIPMICFATVFIRALFFFYAVRDTTNQAAKAPTFSSSTDSTSSVPPITSAQTTAKNVFAKDMNAWSNGVSGTYNMLIVTKTLASGAVSTSSSALPTNSTNTSNLYFIRGTGTGLIQPLFAVGHFLGLNVPGLSGPYPLTVTVDAYVENPNGLTN